MWWRPAGGAVRRRAVPVAGIGALVHYVDTPVGEYDEVFCAIALARLGRPGVSVPFIAVNSPASLEAGRRNWALPKTPATFTGEPGATRTASASGDSWRVAATPYRRGRAVPIRLWLTLLQPGPDGWRWFAPLTVRGVAAPARVAVEVAGGSGAAACLPAGRRWGAVVDAGTLTLGPARSVR